MTTRRRRGRATVDREARSHGEVYEDESATEELDPEVSTDGPFAEVEVSAGVTRKLEDFESLRVTVSIRMPCAPEDVEDTAADIGGRVNTILSNEVSEYMAAEQDRN